jgi:hypothetical protein
MVYIILPMVKINRIAVQAPETPLQALDAVHGGIIAAMVARAANGLDGVCNAIGGRGWTWPRLPMPYC